MSLEGLHQRLAALQETTSQLRELIERLAVVDFQPGSVPLSIEEEGSASSELSVEISTVLRSSLEEQQLLLEEAKYVRPEGRDKTRLRDGIERVGSELSSHRGLLRKARLAAKRNLERAQRVERELVVQSFCDARISTTTPTTTMNTTTATTTTTAAAATTTQAPPPRYTQHHKASTQSALSDKDRQTVGASTRLTDALQRTHSLMTAELTRSEFAQQMLAESTEALGRLDESYVSLDGMLASSRDLLGTLLRSQKSDTWYLRTARWVLLATLAWLVFRRLLYGPMWWLVWWPLRVVFGVGIKAGSAVMAPGRVTTTTAEGWPGESHAAVEMRDAEVVMDGEESRGEEAESMMEKVGRLVDDPGPTSYEGDSRSRDEL